MSLYSYLAGFIFGCYRFLMAIIMWLPIKYVRWLFVKLICRHLGRKCYLSRKIEIFDPRKLSFGDCVIVNKGCVLDGRGEGLVIGSNVDIAANVKIFTMQHDIKSPMHSTISKKVVIEDFVWIATNAIILPGVTIGKGSVIGCGSIVTKSVPAGEIYAGNPARCIGKRSDVLSYDLGKYKTWFE